MQTQEKKPKKERNVYHTPKLVRYGAVAAVTQSGATPDAIEDITSFSGQT
jgi:hypothetical protein